MESSFKKQYESTRHPDGSVELVVSGRNEKPNVKTSPEVKISFVFAFFGGLFFADVTGSFLGFFIGAIVVLFLSLWIFNSLEKEKAKIFLRPSGIEFGKKRLAKADFHMINVMDLTSQDNKGRFAQMSYVYTEALGQEIKLTPYLETPLAGAIKDEIAAYYNFR